MSATTPGEIIVPLEHLLSCLSNGERRWVRRSDILAALNHYTGRSLPMSLIERALRVLVRRGRVSMRITEEATLLYAYDGAGPLEPRRTRLVRA